MNTCVGFSSVEVPPSPKSHDHAVALLDVSVKATDRGAVPEVGVAVKPAETTPTEGSVTVMVTGVASEEPNEFAAVMVTR